MSQGGLLFVIADLGITAIIVRTIARDHLRTNDVIFNGAIIRFFSVLTITLFYISYNSFFGSLTAAQVLLVFLYALINCFAHLFEIAFMGNQKMLPVSLINFCYSVVWFLVVTTLPSSYITVPFLFTIFLLLNALKGFISFIVLKITKLLAGEVRNFWMSSKELLKESWPYFILMLLLTPVNYLSNNFLEINSKIVEVGYFNLAQKLMLPINLVLGFALSAMFPNLSALWVEDEKRFYHLVSAGFKYFMLTALILCFLFTLFAREVVVLIFKAGYLPAVEVCQLQVWFVFLMAVNNLIGGVLGAVNKEKLILRLGLINALITTPMLYYGSKYGALGLSYGYVISFGIYAVYVWRTFKKSVNIKIKNDTLIWALAVLLFLISYFIPQNISLIYKIIPAIMISGVAAVYLTKTIKSVLIK